MRRVRTDGKDQAVKAVLFQHEGGDDALWLHRKLEKWKTQADAIDRIIGDSNRVGRIVRAAAAVPTTDVLEALILVYDRHHVRRGRTLQSKRANVIQQGFGAPFNPQLQNMNDAKGKSNQTENRGREQHCDAK